jgi:acetolactate synthase-1/2/3 large subunit
VSVQLASYLHEQVRRAGADRAFGVPGSYIMPVWQTFKANPRIVLARHESGAAFMADGWSRTTGRPGVVLATIGPGLTNLVTGVAGAYRDSVPLVVVTGQASTSSFGRGAFLESYGMDRDTPPHALFTPITKKSLEITDLRNARFLIDSAFSLAVSGRPGPVHLSIPVDLQAAELPDVGPADGQAEPTAAAPPAALAVGQARDPGVLTDPGFAVAAELAAAARPLILAGWGVASRRLGGDLAALAEQLGAPVVCTAKAISCLPSTHPLHAGHLGPGQRSDLVPFLMSYDPDVVLLLGVSLHAYYAAPLAPLLSRAKTIRVDIDPDQIALRHRPDLAALGDARDLLPRFTAALARMSEPRHTPPEPFSAVLRAFRDRRTKAAAAQPAAWRGRTSMSGTIARLGAVLPPDAVVVPDAGNHWLDTIALHEPARPGGIMLNCGLGAMGWGIGAAVGAALADTGRTTVCITGDGSMLMHGSELSVAAEYGCDLIVLVFNNQAHGRVQLGQRQDLDGDLLGTGLPDIDFARWMGALGLPAETVDRPGDMEAALGRALKTDGPFGIEVRCHPDEVPACMRDWIEDV